MGTYVVMTDSTIDFDTAPSIPIDPIGRLHGTANSRDRAIVPAA